MTHVALFLVVIRLRNHMNFQLLSFITLSVTVFFAENLNTLAGRHWRTFSTQNYFDSGGLFTSTVFSAPLLIIVFTQLVRRRSGPYSCSHVARGAPVATCCVQRAQSPCVSSVAARGRARSVDHLRSRLVRCVPVSSHLCWCDTVCMMYSCWH